MRRTVLIALSSALLLVAVGCGSAPASQPEASAAASAAASASAAGEARLGDSRAVGPLVVTPTRVQQSGDAGATYAGEPENGAFFSVYMRWENVGGEAINAFPRSGIVSSDGVTYGITMVEGPTPSLAHDWTDLPSQASTEGWLTFDVAGDPAKFVLYWDGGTAAADAVGTWMLD